MSVLQKLNIGIVGIGNRSASFVKTIEEHGAARLHAVCDTDKSRLEQLGPFTPGAPKQYTDYGQLLNDPALDAVIISTPMQLHADHAVMALQRNLHVLCEVTPAVTLEQCQQLVLACRRSQGIYMLAENMVYALPCAVITHLVTQGFFGTVYYAAGEYLHSIQELAEVTAWRRTWHVGRDGVTYGTHSLGPVLQWMPGQQITTLTCQGSGAHHVDPEGKSYAQDTAVMLCKTSQQSLIKIRTDLVSPHPFTHNYVLQGTTGCAVLTFGDHQTTYARLWMSELSPQLRWFDLDQLLACDSFGNTCLKDFPRKEHHTNEHGHWGSDYWMTRDFLDAVTRKKPPLLGIHQALDMTIPGLISQQSITQHAAWLDVPDSRTW